MRLFSKKPASVALPTPAGSAETAAQEPKRSNWLKVSIFANIAILLVAATGVAGAVVIHESDTNPNLCNFCHIMRPNVQSYLTSNHLDNVHMQAGVECKECHDYSVGAEITSAINFVTGNYTVTREGALAKRQFSDEMCLQCHISSEHMANSTDFLVRNPHLSHWGDLTCSDCHISHGEQIDLCSECHANGGQRMVGGEIIPRAENPWADPNRARPSGGGTETAGAADQASSAP